MYNWFLILLLPPICKQNKPLKTVKYNDFSISLLILEFHSMLCQITPYNLDKIPVAQAFLLLNALIQDYKALPVRQTLFVVIPAIRKSADHQFHFCLAVYYFQEWRVNLTKEGIGAAR